MAGTIKRGLKPAPGRGSELFRLVEGILNSQARVAPACNVDQQLLKVTESGRSM